MSSSMQPMYGETAAPTPNCYELLMFAQGGGTPGTPVGNGMPQVGNVFTARDLFVSYLASVATDTMESYADSTAGANNYDVDTPLTIWGGQGTLKGFKKKGSPHFEGPWYVNGPIGDPVSGRKNVSANADGKWWLTTRPFTISFASARTAFAVFTTDFGDLGAEIEISFYNGSALVRSVSWTVEEGAKAASTPDFLAYINGMAPFNKAEVTIRQFDAGAIWDYIGFDNFMYGDVPTCAIVPGSGHAVFYGANTGADAAKTVIGPALTARTAWEAAVGSFMTHSFQSETVGQTSVSGACTGYASGFSLAFALTWFSDPYHQENVSSFPFSPVGVDSGASDRWPTNGSDTKWYSFSGRLEFSLTKRAKSIGFYITDLGDQNATLKVTLVNRVAGAIDQATHYVHYVPKAPSLGSATSLLRFWGVSNDAYFDWVYIETMYYDNLTDGGWQYLDPPYITGNPHDTVGIDSIVIGDIENP